jgi:hypothetical protein
MQTENQFSTKPLLRPDQLSTAKDEIKSLEGKLENPLILDKGQVRKQLQQARVLTAQQTPQAPVSGEEEGKMVARSRELLSKIVQGMPSQEEMRKAPPGAVQKHRAWEKRNKAYILEWKNIQLRLTAGSDDREAANLEKHRPTASTLNMDNAFIPGKQIHMPETMGPAVTFNDEQLALLRSLSPEIADKIGTLANPERQLVKDTIAGIGLSEAPPRSQASIDGAKGTPKRVELAKKHTMSEEHKAKLKAGRERAAAERAKAK